MSPPPKFDDFVPATISGSGTHRRSAARAAKSADSSSCCKAIKSSRVDSACCRSASRAGTAVGRRRRANGHNLRVIGNVAKKPGQRGLSTRTLRGGQRQVRFDVEHLALGAQTIEPGGIARLLACREDAGQLTKPISRGHQLSFTVLSREQVGEGEPEVGAQAPDFGVRTARAGGHESRRRLRVQARGVR